MPKKMPDMKYLFNPRSVAVIGASSHPEKIGYKILNNIILSGYKGAIYPINIKGGNILGLQVYKNIADVNEKVDLVVICVPSKFVYEEVKKCSKVSAKFIIIISSGFSEIGNHAEEEKIVNFARNHGMRILGPNVFGMFSATAPINASFGPTYIPQGKIAIISQSGALGGAMIGKTATQHMGLSAIISVGNKADIDEADLLEYFKNDKNTNVILLYIEGVKNGERLIKVFKAMPSNKHIVVIKSGRSKKGALAAASHTGSLAGSDNIFNGIAEQCGILRAESIDEAFNWIRTLSENPVPKGKENVIVTNGGGLGVMCTDACEKHDVPLTDDVDVLKKVFRDIVPSFGSIRNPVDLTGQATHIEYKKALQNILKSNKLDAAIALYCETALFDSNKMFDIIIEAYDKFKGKKPIVFSLFGGEKIDKIMEKLKEKNIPVFEDVYDASSAMGALYKRYNYFLEMEEQVKEQLEKKNRGIKIDKIREIIRDALHSGRKLLLPEEARLVLDLARIPQPKWRIARNIEEAVNYAEEIGYPVVLKVISEDIIHKSDIGGVALELDNREEVIDAYQAIIRNCKKHHPRAKIRGVEVSEMLPKGVEVIVGGTKDPSFGPVVMFGLGGIYVEILKDISFRAAPLSKLDAEKMISSINAYPILVGARGEKRRDIESIVDIIMRIGILISKCKEISDIEINPLLVYEYGMGAKAVDIRILLKAQKGEK